MRKTCIQGIRSNAQYVFRVKLSGILGRCKLITRPSKEGDVKGERKERVCRAAKAVLLCFLVDHPNLLVVTTSAILTGSLITWIDFVDSMGSLINTTFMVFLSRKLRRNLTFEYNYGIGKVEAIASLLCEFFVILGLLCMTVFSVMEIQHPKQPSELLFYVVLIKVLSVGLDIFFYVKERKLCQGGNRVTNSQCKLILKCLVFDAIALVSLFFCYILRDYPVVWYVTPVLCIAIAVWSLFSA